MVTTMVFLVSVSGVSRDNPQQVAPADGYAAAEFRRELSGMRFDVSKEVAACVRKMGGVVLDDILQGPSIPSNADFWFPRHRAIVELKCLSENLLARPEFNRRVSELYASWVKKGLVPPQRAARFTVNLRDLPLACAREFIEPIKRRLEVNALKKANSQIKSLRIHLAAPAAQGLLLLVNDGDYGLTPEMMMHLLDRSMKAQFRSINSVIYFSVNEFVEPGLSNSDTLFWVDAKLPNRVPVTRELREQFRDAWMAHYSGLLLNRNIYEIDAKAAGIAVADIEFKK